MTSARPTSSSAATATARVARNANTTAVIENERQGRPFEDIAHLVKGARGKEGLGSGDTDHGVWTAGMVQGLIRDVPTCKQLIDRIMGEAEAIIAERLAGFNKAA